MASNGHTEKDDQFATVIRDENEGKYTMTEEHGAWVKNRKSMAQAHAQKVVTAADSGLDQETWTNVANLVAEFGMAATMFIEDDKHLPYFTEMFMPNYICRAHSYGFDPSSGIAKEGASVEFKVWSGPEETKPAECDVNMSQFFGMMVGGFRAWEVTEIHWETLSIIPHVEGGVDKVMLHWKEWRYHKSGDKEEFQLIVIADKNSWQKRNPAYYMTEFIMYKQSDYSWFPEQVQLLVDDFKNWERAKGTRASTMADPSKMS